MPQERTPPDRREGRAFGVPARRKDIIALLTEAYVRNDLEQGEFERRLDLAEKARTIEELDEVIADFPSDVKERYSSESPTAGASGVPAKDIEKQIEALDGMAAPSRFVFLGDLRATVLPTEPRVLRAVSIIGDIRVDLRALSGVPGIFLLKVESLIGDLKITLPRGTQVQTRLFNLIGDQSRRRNQGGFLMRLASQVAARFGVMSEPIEGPVRSPGPTVVVMGHMLVGDIKIVED
jgi:hypothetical protein